ncbi:MAG: hypothetical protein H0W12_02515 [Chitinophagaceae bacterium]|nr:hypothetical protein [Chitinophagaceae bacterium]
MGKFGDIIYGLTFRLVLMGRLMKSKYLYGSMEPGGRISFFKKERSKKAAYEVAGVYARDQPAFTLVIPRCDDHYYNKIAEALVG